MKLNEVTYNSLEKYEELIVAYAGGLLNSVSRYRRAVIQAARDAEIAEDLPEWCVGEKSALDTGRNLLRHREQVIDMSSQIIQHVNAAKAPTDPNS